MLKELKQNKVSGILCWKLDRLTRNLLDGATVSDLMENGVIEEIRTPMQVYKNNSIDRLMSGIDILFARKFIDDLSDNVKRGLRAKVQNGWMPGRAPIGYLSDRSDKGYRTIVPDPERYLLIRQMWDMMLSGNHSVPQILNTVNMNWGFRTRRTRRMGDIPLSKSALYKILSNPFYYGQFVYQGELHQGKHKAMITFGEFEQVQLILGRKGKPKPEKHVSAFTGLFRCGFCGAMITAENKIKYVKSTKQCKRYTYYHCSYTKDPNCPRQPITEKDLIQQVDEHLKSITLPEKYLDWILKYYDSVRFKELNKVEHEKHSIKRELSKIEQKLQNLMNLKISPNNEDSSLITDDEFLEQKNRLVMERARLESSLIDYGRVNEKLAELTKETFDLCVYARKWFQVGDVKRKRAIIRKIYRDRRIVDKKVLMSAKKPFELVTTVQFPPDGLVDHIGTKNFGLDKTKNTSSEGACQNWYRQLDELGTLLVEIVSKNEYY